MPIIEIDGQRYEFPDDFTEAEIAEALGGGPAPLDALPNDAGGATAAAMGARGVPGVIQSAGRFAANHPAMTQKAIGAGISTAAGGAGAAVGGVPGAVVGASIRGVTPTQAAIREGAGRLAGESASVARNAGRAMTTINYAKEAGLNLKPTDLASTGEAARAVDNMADSMGQKVVRLYGADNRMVVGPEMPPAPKAPGIVSRVARGAKTASKVFSPLSIATGATDFAQTLEPERRDIGVMGIGSSDPDGQYAGVDTNQAMYDRLAAQDAQRSQLIARIAALLGLN